MIFNAILNSNRSIKSQVISFMVVGITLMTIILSIVTTAGVNQQSRQLMLKNAIQITEGLAEQAVFSLLSGSKQNAQEAMNHVQGFQSVLAVRLLLDDQRVFLASGEYPEDMNEAPVQIAENLFLAETPDYWLIKTPINVAPELKSGVEDEFELDKSVIVEQTIGYAEVIYSKENLQEAQSYVAMMIASVGFVSVILLSVVLRVGLLKLFKPLAELAFTMQQAKQTGKYLLAEIDGAKEIRNMASVYNNMMTVLNQQGDDLKSHRDQLEKEVAIRTLELVAARDEALNASRHKSEFMANMSHELRTPIQSIIGYGELVTEELELEGNFELIDDMDKISKNSQRLLFMINSLLDLAKIEAGKTELNITKVSLSDVFANISDTITPLAHKNHNQFSINAQNAVSHMVVDKEKLEQVLLNLLSNACKFTDHGLIELVISNTAHHINFDIKDTGIGLSSDQQLYIFDEFRQVDASQSRKFSGTGLGLAISKRFIELLQGQITVKSELGKGAIFTIILPLSPPENIFARNTIDPLQQALSR